jgi:methanogenic corrinoid protein MtbC1
MLATPAGDPHVVALGMAGNLLHDAGYDTVTLGADIPPDTLALSAGHHRPTVICMSVTISGRLDQVLRSIDAVRVLCPRVGFVLGGGGLARQFLARPNIHVCQRVSEVVEAADAIVMRAALN